MKARYLHPFLWTIFFVLVEFSAYPCIDPPPEAVFVKQHSPDMPYEGFTRGRLGVPQAGYRTRHLVIIYRYLSGLPLSPEEQSAAVKANDLFNSNWDTDQQNPQRQHAGLFAWIDARKAIGPVDEFTPQNPFKTQDVWQFDSYFENCLDDAFSNAAQTLKARASSYGRHSADVVEWVRGQDAVFHNCDKPQTVPVALPSSAPQWLRSDRAYQQAAALFYRRDYDNALNAFSAIADDPHSPWSALSRYLVGRIMVTRAVNLEDDYPPPGADPRNRPSPDERLALYLGQLRSARTVLLAMLNEPRMQPYTHAIYSMIDRVNARLEPELQTRTLAMRITAPTPDPNLYQDIVDLSFLTTQPYVNDGALANRPHADIPPPANEAERRAEDMLTWIKALSSSDKSTSLERWSTTHSRPWLLAALTFAQPGDSANPELLQAVQNISPNDPSYSAIMYHRLRLLSSSTSTRSELLATLPNLPGNESTSTLNLFAELNARSAPDLKTWLTQAARRPAAEEVYDEEYSLETKPSPQPCGPALGDADTPLFAADVATILNTRLPLHLLVEAAESTTLPPNLRFQVAQAAWTRAVLLDRRDLAARLSPILIRCNAKWQPVLSAYDRARTPKDRKAAALFALMRFASTEPNVREGNYRPDGFASYSYFRDNWWYLTIPPTQHGKESSREYDDETSWAFTSIAHPNVPDPLFLTKVDRIEATQEVDALRSLPSASVYLPSQAIAWQRAYPDDPRAPELLGQALRVVRNAATDKTSSDTEHELFLTLHHKYPTNHWTQRYRTWE